jgi:hypothetical protein
MRNRSARQAFLGKCLRSLLYLTRLHAEHDRVTALLVSLDNDKALDRARAVFFRRVLAALESSIRVEEAR